MRRRCGPAIALATTIVSLAPGRAGAVPDPLAWWPLDDGLDPTAELIDGLAGDLASNNGTSGPTFVAEGGSVAGVDCNRSALYFDGTDAYVAAIDSPAVALDGFTTMTLSAWVKTDGTQGGTVISKYDTHNAWLSWYIGLGAGSLRVRFFIGGLDGHDVTNEVYQGVTGPSIQPGVWTHIAGVWLGGTGQGAFKIYVDGVEGATTYESNRVFTGMYQGSVPIEMGAIHSAAGGFVGRDAFYKGYIDDPRVYSVALGAADLATLAAGGDALDTCDMCPIECQPPVERVFFGVVRRASDGALGSIQCWSAGGAVECRRDVSGALLVGPPECTP